MAAFCSIMFLPKANGKGPVSWVNGDGGRKKHERSIELLRGRSSRQAIPPSKWYVLSSTWVGCEVYIAKRQSHIAQYVATRPLIEEQDIGGLQ